MSSRITRRNLPRNVQVIRREEDAVRDPVAPPEGAVHPGQEQTSKEELLTEHCVEDPHNDHDAEPDPVAAEEALPRVRLQEGAPVTVVGHRGSWEESLDGKRHRQGDQNQPEPAADAAASRTPRRSEPERFAHRRPPKGPQLPADEDGNEPELPDQPYRE